MVGIPGSAGLVLIAGVAHLNGEGAVFKAMLTGWGRQQASRLLGEDHRRPGPGWSVGRYTAPLLRAHGGVGRFRVPSRGRIR